MFVISDRTVEVVEGIPDSDVLQLFLAGEAAINILEGIPARDDPVVVQTPLNCCGYRAALQCEGFKQVRQQLVRGLGLKRRSRCSVGCISQASTNACRSQWKSDGPCAGPRIRWWFGSKARS